MSRRYDSRTTIFSPEGRLYQVEYAMEAIGNAGSAIGILAKDGVVLVGEKKVTSKLLQTSKSTEKMYKIDDHLACAVAGIMSDANILINTARVQAQRDDESIPTAFNLGCYRIETAKDSEGRLISGYFLVVCAVLPDLAPLAERIMNALGFRVDGAPNISHVAKSCSGSLRLQAVKFAQMCFLPFLKKDAEVGTFWTRIATILDVEPSHLFGSTKMKSIYSLLSFSALLPMLQEQTTVFFQNLMVVSPYGLVFSKVVQENRKAWAYLLPFTICAFVY